MIGNEKLVPLGVFEKIETIANKKSRVITLLLMKLFKILYLFLISLLSTTTYSQQINTDYFIENNPRRQDYNPAFKPKTDYFISLPILGMTQLSLGNNSLTVSDLVYTVNGQTISFKHPDGNTDKLYNVIQPNTLIRADAQTNILAFGWRIQRDFLTFSLTEKSSASVGLPKDLFKFLLYGTPDIYNNAYNLTKFQSDISFYTEAAACYTLRVNREFTIGAKVKLLLGNANVSFTNQQLNMQAGINEWTLKGSGSVNYAGGLPVTLDNQLQSLSIKGTPTLLNFLNKPSGIGTGIDLGIRYRVDDNIVLSASLLDFGIISWYNNLKNVNYNMDYKYDGIKQINGTTIFTPTDILAGNAVTDSLLKVLKSSLTINQTTKAYTTATTAKVNVGFEYRLMQNKLSLGLLSHSQFINNTIIEEVTASVNGKPTKWFNGCLSYSVFNGRFSTIGLGFGLKTGIVHWLVGADYIQFQSVKIPFSVLGNNNFVIPYRSAVYNLSLGVNIVFNRSTAKRMHNRTGLYGYDTDED